MSIPVIGVPVINRADLLLRCLRSIDFPVDKLVVVDNGGEPEVAAVLAQVCQEGRLSIAVHSPGFNMGVSGSWNWILDDSSDAAYWLFVGNDIEFLPGDLARIDAFVREHPDYVVMPCNHGHSLFAVTAAGKERIGYFDANIFPAYLEDSDQMRRIALAGAPWQDVPGVRALHGEAPSWGSSTIYADPKLFAKNQITHRNNFLYYQRKHGGPPGEEKFEHPYDDPLLTWKDWRIDESLAVANENILLCRQLGRAVDDKGVPW